MTDIGQEGGGGGCGGWLEGGGGLTRNESLIPGQCKAEVVPEPITTITAVVVTALARTSESLWLCVSGQAELTPVCFHCARSVEQAA